MKHLSLIASALAVLGLTACEKGLEDETDISNNATALAALIDEKIAEADVDAISDWRLPTYDELNAMYAAIDDINEAFGTDITELCSPTTSR